VVGVASQRLSPERLARAPSSSVGRRAMPCIHELELRLSTRRLSVPELRPTRVAWPGSSARTAPGIQ